MFGKALFRKGFVGVALGALMLLSACTMISPPASSGGEGAPPAAGSEGATAIAEFVLPDGTSCLFAGTGATVAFDDKRVNYTCTPLIATESVSQTQALLGDPIVAGETEYAVDFAVIANTDGGFELHSSQVVTFTAWQVTLVDGRVCLHAGFGATMGFDGQRLNYTCDKGDSTAEEVGLMGELVNQGEGVWVAQIDEIGRDANGFVQLSSTQVAVAQVNGVDMSAAGGAAPISNELVGTSWQWVQTQYGDDSVLVASDPANYLLTFNDDGFVAVQFDCNSGGGSYTIDGSSLFFGPMISTMMMCPDGSQATEFSADLAEVQSFVLQDGHLFLALKLDTGIMEFAPVAAAESSEEAVNHELVGTSWQWVQTQYGDDSLEVAVDPTRYTLTFNEDGTVAVQLDCNSGFGDFSVGEGVLSFGPLASTRMGCPEDSQAAVFGKDLEAVVSYVIQDGHLFLALLYDSGIMEFAPVDGAVSEEAGEQSGEEASRGELVGTTWQWVQTQYGDDTLEVAVDPTRYTVTFNEDNTVSVQLDCNSGFGEFTVDGPMISFGPIASTMMGCPEDSQDGVFGQDLASVVSYVFQDGHLFLALQYDSGIMEFAPAE